MAEIQWKGAIFDLDGTLLDSMGVWSQVDIDFLKKRNLAVPEDYMQKIYERAVWFSGYTGDACERMA